MGINVDLPDLSYPTAQFHVSFKKMAYEELFDRLSRSEFRSGFRLNSKDAHYLKSKGLARVMIHGREFVIDRLAPAQPFKDGAQTPTRGHPVFVAQHATGTCCRPCLSKYHAIELNRELTDHEVKKVVLVIGEWLQRQTELVPTPVCD
ncbi:MAG: DUF4186 domain-containing protein [Proteobacteria bacterium]|nr:MAG: DUF4186 domain-containing protein [Pseudomonadota bacterium]RYZ63636.1 MAG: DUF4186 domain-containing protein [Pseudomonadota bacterium]